MKVYRVSLKGRKVVYGGRICGTSTLELKSVHVMDDESGETTQDVT